MKILLKLPNPYSHIHKLPELSNKFEYLHQAILEKETKPIKQDIDDNLNHVLDELNF